MVIDSSSESDQFSFTTAHIPSAAASVDLLHEELPLKATGNGAENDVDIVGIFDNGEQDAVFPEMPGGMSGSPIWHV